MQHALSIGRVLEPLGDIAGQIPDTIGRAIPEEESQRTGLTEALFSGIGISISEWLSPGIGTLLGATNDPSSF